MCKAGISKSRRIIGGFLAVLTLSVLLFCALYIASEADHDCTGENCPICTCIQQCENTLQKIGNGIAAGILAALPARHILFLLFPLTFVLSQETPVSRKVRLNN